MKPPHSSRAAASLMTRSCSGNTPFTAQPGRPAGVGQLIGASPGMAADNLRKVMPGVVHANAKGLEKVSDRVLRIQRFALKIARCINNCRNP
jgi:hypothetical protein